MAKQVQLKQNGTEVYPRTITDAIADTTRAKLLSTVIGNLESASSGWTISSTQTPGTSAITISLTGKKYDYSNGQWVDVDGGSINIAGDIYLEDVQYSSSTHTMYFKYNTAGGEEVVGVNLDDLVDVYGGDGKAIVIDQDTEGAHNSTISLKLNNAANNILSADANGLLATINATGDTYVSANIDATDKNKVVITTDVATTFSAVTGSETASGQLADAAQVKKYIDDSVSEKNVDAESLSPEYITADASNNTVSISAVTGSITYTAKSGDNPANLAGTQGIADAAATATAVKNYVDAKVAEEEARVDALTDNKNDGDYINVKVTTLGGNVSNVEVNENNILTTSGAVESVSATGKLVDAKAIKDYVDAKTGDLDASVSGQTSDEFIKVTVVQENGALKSVTVVDDTQEVATAGINAKGLAEASDVKSYVDGQISNLAISATGDTYVNAAVDASNNKKINVSTNVVSVVYADSALTIGDTDGVVNKAGAQSIKNYIDEEVASEESARIAAINALNANETGTTTDGFISVNVVEQSGKTTSVVVTDTVVAVSAATVSNKGLAEASDVKSYVDAKVSASTIIDSADIDATETASGTTLAIKYGSIASGATSAVTGGNIFAWGVTAEDKGDVSQFTWPTA